MAATDSHTSARPIEILLVEDNDADAFLTQKAFDGNRIINRVHRVEDGVNALAYLRHQDPYIDAVRPDLILLDLNMPRKNGREVLKEIKNDPDLRRIPVVVFTTSDDEKDVFDSYEQQANSYITKPVDLEKLREVLQKMKEYWFSIVKLPPTS
ncbi:MAG: response regulator [Planctomycetales bacterium]|nr:response regulator [Planctomycetales bacterium]MCA9166123.1 response regulator [Planctomycetales bacterium]